jgi:hypothetical protein
MSEAGPRLTPDEEQRLRRCYDDLKQLAATCQVPSVRSAARAAVAQVYTALSGQGLAFEMYSADWAEDEREGH